MTCILFNFPSSALHEISEITGLFHVLDIKIVQGIIGNYRPQSEEIMYLVASIHLSVCSSVRLTVCPSVRPSPLSRLNRLLSAAKSKEESLSVWGVCLCDKLSRGCGRLDFLSICCEMTWLQTRSLPRQSQDPVMVSSQSKNVDFVDSIQEELKEILSIQWTWHQVTWPVDNFMQNSWIFGHFDSFPSNNKMKGP